jgi:type I restriction enzyme S subunit
MPKGYREYKNTNYDWLPQIPAHWKWIYLSQSCKEQCVKNSEYKENKVLSLSYGTIIIKKDINFGLVPKEYSGYQIVDKGNIILRLTDLQNDHTNLRTGLVKERGIITSAYTCLKPYENPNYLQYLLHSYDTQKVFYGMGGGVRQSIGFKEIRNMNIPLPPRSEQDQIVRYLDWKVSMISKYISAKKK